MDLKTRVFQHSSVCVWVFVYYIFSLFLSRTHTQGFIISISVSNWHKTSKTAPNKPLPLNLNPSQSKPRNPNICENVLTGLLSTRCELNVSVCAFDCAYNRWFITKAAMFPPHSSVSFFSPPPLKSLLFLFSFHHSYSLSQLNKVVPHSLALDPLFLSLFLCLCVLWRKFSGVFLCAWSNHVVADSD